ncbi:hypothetical protein CEXT_134811 [Caerostris extrusa]|uniref:Uncharacterized protein n=1 Tax=Caerostris extrusa TaxID=172846 RepID=A0AAV4XB93_CAEEX|nr:hypothetical protein CEXT_134811 [Caerostris extrusa]
MDSTLLVGVDKLRHIRTLAAAQEYLPIVFEWDSRIRFGVLEACRNPVSFRLYAENSYIKSVSQKVLPLDSRISGPSIALKLREVSDNFICKQNPVARIARIGVQLFEGVLTVNQVFQLQYQPTHQGFQLQYQKPTKVFNFNTNQPRFSTSIPTNQGFQLQYQPTKFYNFSTKQRCFQLQYQPTKFFNFNTNQPSFSTSIPTEFQPSF